MSKVFQQLVCNLSPCNPQVTLQRGSSVSSESRASQVAVRRGRRSASSEPLDLRQLVEEVRLGRRDVDDNRRRGEVDIEEEEEEEERPLTARAVSRWRARKREEGRLARRMAALARQRGRGGRRQ